MLWISELRIWHILYIFMLRSRPWSKQNIETCSVIWAESRLHMDRAGVAAPVYHRPGARLGLADRPTAYFVRRHR